MSKSKKRFFPVVHCVDPFQQQGFTHAIENTRIALEHGADGVFLIGHDLEFFSLAMIYDAVRAKNPYAWIGVNFLDTVSRRDWALLTATLDTCRGLNALWTDVVPDPTFVHDETIELFGGVAFKNQHAHIRGRELETACVYAQTLVHTITTSGTATGSPPDVAKVEEIRRHVGPDARLALASGVSAENVEQFLPTVDTFLVASSLNVVHNDQFGHEYFDSERMEQLAMLVHAQKEEVI